MPSTMRFEEKFPALLDLNQVLQDLSLWSGLLCGTLSMDLPPLILSVFESYCKELVMFASVDVASHEKKGHFVFLL